MIVQCFSPGCIKTKTITLFTFLYWILTNRKWACPQHMERLNGSNPKYDDHDPLTNPDLKKYRK